MEHHNTILACFLHWEATCPEDVFLRQPIGKNWKVYSWKDAGALSRNILRVLRRHGFNYGDRMAILSANCAEWIIYDLAMMMGGFISVPLYANVNAHTMQDILSHSGSSIIFIGKLVAKDWEQQKIAIPPQIQTVTMEGHEKKGIQSWTDYAGNTDVDNIEIVNKPSDIYTLIYTSGTTGKPKGVIHSNQSVINAVKTAEDLVLLNRRGNRFVSYLPLSHAAERGLVEAGAIYSGGTISFVESQESFTANIQDTSPTHFFAVPRIWEKIQSKILEKMSQKKLSRLLAIPVVSSLVKSKIKKSLGLDSAEVVLSGAAPLSAALIKWYQKIGINIREAYGMSENFNVLSINPKNNIHPGTVGILFGRQEVLIDPETQEIKQKCNWLMQGYYNDPEMTDNTIKNGFLHTGDMGKFTADGYLMITGRVKDIFKTSKGEYIIPQPLEKRFIELNIVDQACVMGTKYPQPFVLIVLSEIGKTTAKPSIDSLLVSILDQCNQNVMQYQMIKKVIVVKEEWTVENELLTPSLKMKRNALSAKYESFIENLYEENTPVSWEN